MFELVMIALASATVAILMVWLFRKLTDSRGVSTASLSGSGKPAQDKRKRSHANWDGTVSDRRASRKPRNAGDAKPWGW